MGKTNKSDPIIVGTEMRASGAVLVVLAALAVYAQSLTTDEWDLSTGLAMARYSAAAYCEQADLEPWDCPICDGNTTGFVVTKYFLDPKTSTNAYVGYDESREMIVLAFEGSANFSNWVTNLEFFRVDFDYPNATGARVHGGFYKAYQSVGVDVEKDVGRWWSGSPPSRSTSPATRWAVPWPSSAPSTSPCACPAFRSRCTLLESRGLATRTLPSTQPPASKTRFGLPTRRIRFRTFPFGSWASITLPTRSLKTSMATLRSAMVPERTKSAPTV